MSWLTLVSVPIPNPITLELLPIKMQPAAKEARRPFETGPLTKETGAKCFGVKIFFVLAIKYQRIDPAEQGADPKETLNIRVAADGSLSTTCGPYARLLYDVMALVDGARAKGELAKVRQIGSPNHMLCVYVS